VPDVISSWLSPRTTPPRAARATRRAPQLDEIDSAAIRVSMNAICDREEPSGAPELE
jgi:hypothetical protein